MGVVLAAGRGLRMGALGTEFPKALLPVANEPLIGHHLHLLAQLGIVEVFVVVGHRAADVVGTVGDGSAQGVRVRYVEQGQALGSAHALAQLRPEITRPFLLILGDYFFRATDPSRMLKRLEGGTCAIMAKREPETHLIAEACALEVDRDGRVLDIVEKPMHPGSRLKGCGFYAFSLDFFDAVARTPRTALRDEYELTVSLELYAKSGRPVFAEEIVAWDANLTRPEDVLECNLRRMKEEGRRSVVADGARVDPSARLDEAVIGPRAEIARDVRLTRVVVFPEARVDEAGAVITNALVTPASVIPCATRAEVLSASDRHHNAQGGMP